MCGESEAQKRHTSQVSKSFLELCCFLAAENARFTREARCGAEGFGSASRSAEDRSPAAIKRQG